MEGRAERSSDQDSDKRRKSLSWMLFLLREVLEVNTSPSLVGNAPFAGRIRLRGMNREIRLPDEKGTCMVLSRKIVSFIPRASHARPVAVTGLYCLWHGVPSGSSPDSSLPLSDSLM